MNGNELFVFLESKGFHLVDSKNSSSFGDYYYILTNNIFSLRFVKDKSIISIDIQSALKNNESWYDLALIKNLLYNDIQLDIAMTSEQYCEFLKNEIDNITILFNSDDYFCVKKRIDNLKEKRIKQMFSWL